jgi:hypothetical protein
MYFFFEDAERRIDSGVGPRVVRVGAHALTATSRTTLWNRLSQHRGVLRSGAGNHRGSVFRLLVGDALLRRDGVHLDTWGVGDSPATAARERNVAPATIHEAELATEQTVSRVIGGMPFLWVGGEEPAGADTSRAIIERNAIALLSNFGKAPIDLASRAWLGLDSSHDRVRKSGLWNRNHVDEGYDSSFLDLLARAAAATPAL